MNSLFERTSSHWVRYSEYEWKTAGDGILYLTPASDAEPSVYNPLKEYQQLVLDAIDIGRMGMTQDMDDQTLQDIIRQFTFRKTIILRKNPWRQKITCVYFFLSASWMW